MATQDSISTKANGVNGESYEAPLMVRTSAEEQIKMRQTPAYTPRRLRVITIGAGYSGLTLAHKFQHQHPELQDIIDHTIYESRSELGGTWLVNTYPGVLCDVPSHIYVSCPPLRIHFGN